MKRVWDRRWRWQLAASSAYIQVVFNWKCIGTLPNWRLVAGGGNRQVKLRAGSNVHTPIKSFDVFFCSTQYACMSTTYMFLLLIVRVCLLHLIDHVVNTPLSPVPVCHKILFIYWQHASQETSNWRNTWENRNPDGVWDISESHISAA